MASNATASLVARQATVFLSGAGVVVVSNAHLYACGVVLALCGIWAATSLLIDRSRTNAAAIIQKVQSNEGSVQWSLLGSALDQLPAPIVFHTRSGIFRAANREARVLFDTDDRIVALTTDFQNAVHGSNPHSRVVLTDPTKRAPRTFALSLIDTHDDDLRSIIMLLDIEPEIRAAEASALRDMMQVLSHEIMNAMTPVASLAATAQELLSEGTPEAGLLAREALETVGRRAEGLSRFVEAYRQMARLPTPVPRPSSVRSILEEADRIFRSYKENGAINLHVDLPEPDIIGSLDADLVVHALTNILSNAAHAVSSSASPAIVLSAPPIPSGIRFAVTDNGPGVPEHDREAIFRPFYTTKINGSGVGLSFARQVALSHGGDLVLLESIAGATFELTL